MPGNMPNRMSDRMPEDMPDKMPNRISEDILDRIPENLSVFKYINIMMEIIRNKIIFSIWGIFKNRGKGLLSIIYIFFFLGGGKYIFIEKIRINFYLNLLVIFRIKYFIVKINNN